MSKIPLRGAKATLFVGLLASSVFVVSRVVGQSAQGNVKPTVTATPPASSVASTPHGKVSPYRPTTVPGHAKNFYSAAWGVDSFSVKSVESGQMIRFSYRVLDAKKAKPLNDKRATPYLIDEKARVKLVVPTMEKVGQLRQSSTPEVGKEYWMVFSNKGGIVKRGDRITVEIGKFRVGGLVVQ